MFPFPKAPRKRDADSVDADHSSAPAAKRMKVTPGEKPHSQNGREKQQLSKQSPSKGNQPQANKQNKPAKPQPQSQPQPQHHGSQKGPHQQSRPQQPHQKQQSQKTQTGPSRPQSAPQSKQPRQKESLLDRFSEKLQGSKFRWINELLYTKPSDESKSLFDSDPSLFDTYHTGFESQVKKWPVNPLDRMIARVKKMDKSLVIADMGCGTAQLALQVPQKVHSFDMVARNERITAADMAHVPLPDASVDVVIYCLSLMGTNVADFLRESNRILRPNGKVLVAEVSSRFEDVQKFVSGWSELGFRCTQQDLKGSFFFYFEFEKTEAKPNRKTVVTLRPCMYKKR